jgi:hypothetical protein
MLWLMILVGPTLCFCAGIYVLFAIWRFLRGLWFGALDGFRQGAWDVIERRVQEIAAERCCACRTHISERVRSMRG